MSILKLFAFLKRLFFGRRSRRVEQANAKIMIEKKEGLFSIMDAYIAFLEQRKRHVNERRTEALVSIKKAINRDSYQIALAGFGKRGKSTLLNALLGDRNHYDLSPVSIVPCTAAIVRYIDSALRPSAKGKEGAIVHFIDGNSKVIRKRDLPQYIDQANPAFQKDRAERIEHIEVFGSFPLIKTGGVIIDTPGLEALHDQDDLAKNILPEADLILYHVFLNNLDRPEHDFLADLHPREKRKLMFVLTQTDHAKTEENLSKVVSYTQKQIEPILGKMSHLYQVAADKVLEAYKAGESREEIENAKKTWGMKDLEDALLEKIRNRPNAEDRLRSACKELREFIDDDTKHLNGQEDKLKAELSELEKKREALSSDCDEVMLNFKQGTEALKEQWKRTVGQFTQELKEKKTDIAGRMISVVKKEKIGERIKRDRYSRRAKTLQDMLQSCLDEDVGNLKSKLKKLINACAKKLECNINVDLRIGYEVKTGIDRLKVKTIPGIVEMHLHEAAASIEESSGKALENVLPLFKDHQNALMAVKQGEVERAYQKWKTLTEDMHAVKEVKAELEKISGDLTRFMDGL